MIKVFEGFVGYGGASFGLQKAGIDFEVVGYSEIDKGAIKCFEQNFPNIKNYGDIKNINPNDLPDFDLFTGGFPCQDVSIAGNRDLSKGRTNLYLEILRIVKVKKPKYLVLENVKGLLSMEIDEGKLIHKIIRDLQKIGYGVAWKVLNSKDYGIPQNRERVWFVCKLGGWNFMEFTFPEKEELKIKLKDLLEKEIDKRYYLSEESIDKLRKRNERFNTKGNRFISIQHPIFSTLTTTTTTNDSLIVLGGSQEHQTPRTDGISPSLNSAMGEGGGHTPLIFDYYNWKLQEDIVPALTDPKHNNLRLLENMKVRKLTPKECFRLMGFFKDEIKLDGLTITQKYKLAGNGWDINLVSKIFKKLKKQFEDYETHRT